MQSPRKPWNLLGSRDVVTITNRNENNESRRVTSSNDSLFRMDIVTNVVTRYSYRAAAVAAAAAAEQPGQESGRVTYHVSRLRLSHFNL